MRRGQYGSTTTTDTEVTAVCSECDECDEGSTSHQRATADRQETLTLVASDHAVILVVFVGRRVRISRPADVHPATSRTCFNTVISPATAARID